MLKRGFQFAPGYRLQEFLGRGQFGQVWRATAPGGAAAAVKFIDLSDGQGQKEYDGVRRVKQIRHANLMPITAIWLLDGEGKVIEEAPDMANETIDLSVLEGKGQSGIFTPQAPEVEPSWLVVSMLLGGKSLQARLRECVKDGLPGIPAKELISYMDESAKGIDFLNAPQHDLGEGPIAIQHSDIKPANIVLIGSSAVVCDFGLARILTRNQVTATSASGTPAYMAPEAISGKPSRTSDQYALAVTYYHLRTGTLPVGDSSLWEVLDAHRQGKLKFDRVREAERDVLKKATDLKWENRFESSVDMVDALRDALRAEGETKPGFIAPSRSSRGETPVAVGENGATVGETSDFAPLSNGGEDFTATLDTVPTPPASMAPFSQAATPDDQPVGDAPLGESSNESDRPTVWMRDPRVIVAGGAAAVAVLMLLALALVDEVPKNKALGKRKADGEPIVVSPDEAKTKIDPVINVDADALYADAVSMLVTDPVPATDTFRRVIAAKASYLTPRVTVYEGHQGEVTEIVGTGDRLISIADGPEPLLWKLGESQFPTPLLGHQTLAVMISLSPDGGRLISGGFDATARIWDLTADDVPESVIEVTEHPGEVRAAAWHPNFPEVPVAVTASLETIGVWDLGSGDPQSTSGRVTGGTFFVENGVTSLAIDPDAKWLAAIITDALGDAPQAVAFPLDEVLGTMQTQSSAKPIALNALQAETIAFVSAKGGVSQLVVGGSKGSLSIVNVSGDPDVVGISDRAKDAHTASVGTMKVVRLASNDVIVTGSDDGSVHRWTIPRRSTFQVQLGSVTVFDIDVSPDGRWIAAGVGDGTVWLIDGESQTERRAFQLDTGAASVDSVWIDPNGKWLVAGTGDGKILAWELPHIKLLTLAMPTPLNGTEVPTEAADMSQYSSL